MVYDNGMELEQLYKEGGPFPDYLDREFVILLEASAGEGQSTLLVLPDSPARLEPVSYTHLSPAGRLGRRCRPPHTRRGTPGR